MGETWMRYGLIPLLTMFGPGSAGSATAAEAGTPEEEVVLEAGQIDARTVPAGARVVVVHGRGERHRVSGEWARLDTSAGWVQAVDVSALVLARERDLRQQRIPLDRIQRLVMEGLPLGGTAIDSMGAAKKGRALPGNLPVQVPGREDQGARIIRKLGAGALGGILTGVGGTAVGFALVEEDDSEDDIVDSRGTTALFLGAMGYAVGAAVGVSWPDTHDPFIAALGGSSLGLGAGLWLTVASPKLWPTLLAGPIITATMMSEWFRDPPRLSFGLRPTPGKGIAAAAALRF